MQVTRRVYAQIIQAIELNRTLNVDTNNITHHDTKNNRTTTLTFNVPSPKTDDTIAWINPIRTVINPAIRQGIIKNAIIHGSCGDFTTTPFSDLEITLIISSEQIYNQNQRSNLHQWVKDHLNPLILTIDPLQHHGAFYLWSELINRYDERILPLAAYQNAWAINPVDLTFNHCLQVENDRTSIEATITALKNYEHTFFKYGMTPYSIKRMLSNIMLLPALCYQSRGEMISKPDALQKIRDDTPAIVTELLDEATRLRAEWSKTPTWVGKLRTIINKGSIPSGRRDLLLTSLYRRKSLQRQFANNILTIIPEFCVIIEQNF